MNLAGVHHDEVARGDALVRPGQWHPHADVRRIPARPRVRSTTTCPGAARSSPTSAAANTQSGSAVLGPGTLGPGDDGFARLHLSSALPLTPGDRYVLRESGRSETVGGGEILDVDPVVPRRSARIPTARVDRVVAERGWVTVTELERLTGERRDATVGRWVVDAERARAPPAMASSRASRPPESLGLDIATLDERDRAVLDMLAAERRCRGRRRPRRAAPEPRIHSPATPTWPRWKRSRSVRRRPTEFGVDPVELRELVRRGLVVEQDGVWFAPAAIDEAARSVAAMLADTPDGVAVADVRAHLGTTRKWAVPLLTILDSRGITRRRGDLRIAGPRLPGVSTSS